MNRAVIIGTVYEAWRALQAVCQAMDGCKVLDAAVEAAIANERSHRRGKPAKSFRVGSIVAARLDVLTHACLVAGRFDGAVPLPSSWTAFAAMDRSATLACALGEQIRARHLGAAAFPKLHFLEICYSTDIIIQKKAKP